jgi:hypothetical protein
MWLRYDNDQNRDRRENQLSTENDKSLKEDYIMRLYEFTDPTKYLQPETDVADLLKKTKTADPDCHLRKKLETEKPAETV